MPRRRAASEMLKSVSTSIWWIRSHSSVLIDRKPYPNSVEDITALAGDVRDANFRIMTAPDGIHVFNASGHATAQDAFELFPRLDVESDGAHAFYLGAELTKAEIAWKLGKRYAQDEPLSWGAGVPEEQADRLRLKEAGHTLRAKKDRVT